MHLIGLWKRNYSIPEHIKYQNAVISKLQTHGRFVCIKKQFRCILAGQLKFFQHFYRHRYASETLGSNGFLQRINILFVNPLSASDIDSNVVFFLVNRDFCNHHFF